MVEAAAHVPTAAHHRWSWDDVVAPLLQVEALPPDATGMLACGVGAAPAGAIFIEDGRVCWVAAHGLKRRLSDILGEQAHLSGAELQVIYERCRAEAVPLGQALVAAGKVSPRHLREVLRRHSAESLVSLAGDGGPWRWLPRQKRGYRASFTFSTTTLLLETSGLYYRDEQAAAAAELERFAGLGQRAAAFLFDGAALDPLPLAVADAETTTVTELLALGAWAAQVPAAAAELGEAPSVVLAQTDDGRGGAVWLHGPAVVAITCANRDQLGALMSRHFARGA